MKKLFLLALIAICLIAAFGITHNIKPQDNLLDYTIAAMLFAASCLFWASFGELVTRADSDENE